jgi:hypothetical protein
MTTWLHIPVKCTDIQILQPGFNSHEASLVRFHESDKAEGGQEKGYLHGIHVPRCVFSILPVE